MTFRVTDQAFPTSRCLSGTDGFWAAEEWCEPGTVGGQKAKRYYLFSAAEIDGLLPEDYPFDDDHVSRIVVE